MMYLDTNIFFYLADRTSIYHTVCKQFGKRVAEKSVMATTCTETIQEIGHFYRASKQHSKGLLLIRYLLKLIPAPLPVNESILPFYIQYFKKYAKVESRDLIHLSVCKAFNINTIVTYDRHFRDFKEIRTLTPEDLI